MDRELILKCHSEASREVALEIERQHPELFNKLEVGKWYKLEKNNSLFCLTSFSFINQTAYGYGFIEDGWIENIEENSPYCMANFAHIQNLIEASDEEVKIALEKEATKRGFVQGAKFIDCNGDEQTFNRINFYVIKYGKIYNPLNKFNIAGQSAGAVIFRKGTWATVIPTPEKKCLSLEEAKNIIADKLNTTKENIEITL